MRTSQHRARRRPSPATTAVLVVTALVTLGVALVLLGPPGTGSPATERPSEAGPAGTVVPGGPDPLTHGGTLSNGCHFDPRGLPSCGAYVGAAHGSNDQPRLLEAVAGRPLGLRRTFFTGSQVGYAVATAARDLAAGRLPWISFKLPAGWAAMADGDGDAWALDLATRLAALPGPVWVAFHHEPEGDGDLDEWRAMQERLAPLVRDAAPNVAYTVIVTGWNQLYGDPAYALAAIWPRGVTIDVAGFDVYDEYGSVREDGSVVDDVPDVAADFLAPLSQWARREGVAWGLAETGVTDESFELAPDWIGATFDAVVTHGGVAMSYFDSPLHHTTSYELDGPGKLLDFSRTLARGASLSR